MNSLWPEINSSYILLWGLLMFLVWSAGFLPGVGYVSLAEPALVVVKHGCSLLSISYQSWHFFKRHPNPEDYSVCNLVIIMSSGSSEQSVSWAELLVADLSAVMRNKVPCPQFPHYFSSHHRFTSGTCNATSCYTAHLGYFSSCFLWVCVFVIKTSSASWLHPRSVLFLSLSLLIPKLVLLFQF